MTAATISTVGHIDGRPVSESTYKNHKCRCDGCRAMYRQGQRERYRQNGATPSLKAKNKARDRASQWVRENHPDVWAELYAEAYREVTR